MCTDASPPTLRHVARFFFAAACICLLVPSAHALTDSDGDLLPDAYETQWDFNPDYAPDADNDNDNDRLSNRDEFFIGTDPTVFTDVTQLTDRQVLDLFESKAFVYFWEQSRPPYYLTPDSAHFNDKNDFSDHFNSIASTGFSMVSYVTADARGWVDHQLAYERIRLLLERLVELQGPAYDVFNPSDPLPDPPLQGQANRHGYLYHFLENDGTRLFGTEISTIDHALLVAGALVAGEYYKGTEVEQLAQQLYLNTDWNWLWNGTYLWQGWFEDPSRGNFGLWEGGSVDDRWNRYSELMVLLLLAMGHPDAEKTIPNSGYPDAWDELTRDFNGVHTNVMFFREYAHLFPGASPPNTAPQSFGFVPDMPSTLDAAGYSNNAGELHYLHAGSLHNHQYSHMYIDFRNRKDAYNTDYFANSISATLVNREYAVNLNLNAYGSDPNSTDSYLLQPYETYGPNSWGLMAGIGSTGYEILAPIVMAYENFSPAALSANNDSGTVLLNAPLGSTAFTPRQSIDMARTMLNRFQAGDAGYDDLIGRYGFRNAFNLGRTESGRIGHFPSATIALDLGPVVGNIENHLSGLIWKFLMRNAYLQQGMAGAGFELGAVEPFILNFDDNPPAPHEDPNGGGQDPHAFGGGVFAFGNAASAYLVISDPFPAQDYGPQGWVQQITATDNNDSGAFLTLNNHSVSSHGRISFWIRGAQGGEAYQLGLKDSVVDILGNPLQATEVKVNIADYHPSGQITAQWTEVRVPLRVFQEGGVRLTALDNLSLTNLDPAGGEILIDDIAFLPDEFAPAQPQSPTMSVVGQDVVLDWTFSSEPDVVGYNVWRRAAGTADGFVALNNTLIVGETYTDAAVPHGAYEYSLSAVDNASVPNQSLYTSSQIVLINEAPVITPISGVAAVPGETIQFTVTATDADGDAVSLDATLSDNTPLGAIGASFSDHNDGSGLFEWTPQSSQEGEFTVRFHAYDGFEHSYATVLIIVGPDTSAPVVAIHQPAAGTVIPFANLVFAGTVADPSPISDVRVYVYDWARRLNTVSNAAAVFDSAAGTWSIDVSVNSISQGSKATFWVRAQDSAGNWSGWVERTVDVEAAFQDVAAPVITIQEPPEGSLFSSNGGLFVGSIADESPIADVRIYVYDWGRATYTVANVQANFDSATGDWSFEILPQHLSAGRKATFWVRAQDAAGNWSTWRLTTVTVQDVNIDTLPPIVLISEPAIGSLFPAAGGLFTGTVTDNVAVSEVRVYVYDWQRQVFTVSNASAAYVSVSNSFSFNVDASAVTPGSQVTFWVRAIDTSDNRSVWVQRTVDVETVFIDTQRPDVTIVNPVGGSVFSAGGSFNGTIADVSPIQDVRIYVYDWARGYNTVINAQAVFDAAGNWNFAVQPQHVTIGSDATFWVRAQDTAGNWSLWKESKVQIE